MRPSNDRRSQSVSASQRSIDQARLAAFEIMQAVTLDGAYANLVTAETLARRRLDHRDAAFVTELVYGTCRGLGTYDAIIEQAANRSLNDLEAGVIDVLRLATHQLLNMRIPTHAAVDSSVNLAAIAVGHRVAGLVNAVTRRIARRHLEDWLDFLSEAADQDQERSLRTMHPQWIIAAYAELLPAEELTAALLANNVAPDTTLVIRPGLATQDELGGEPTRYSPYGAHIQGKPGDLECVRTGRAGVQDEGSQLVAMALAQTQAQTPSGPWLDICAGPGGKAALLTGLALAHSEKLVAVEVQPHRAMLIKQALRCYPGIASVVCADATEPAWPKDHFSKVLADVPCSGLGALRRRPESRWRHQPEDLAELHPLQLALLANAVESTAPGGVIAYVTCSPHRMETAAVVDSVRDHVDILDAPAVLAQVPNCSATTDPRYVQLWPHRHGTDAMFLALLRRR